MPKSLKIFIGAYDKNMSCRCHPEYDTRHVIISAMTKSQAIGFALEAHPDTDRLANRRRRLYRLRPS
jgi:hypothetical protein